MPAKSAAQLDLEKIAAEAVTITRKFFPLGSGNINCRAFSPRFGMLQYQPEQQKRFSKSVRQAEALTLVRNEDVRDLPGVYKYQKKMRSLDSLLDKPRNKLAAYQVGLAQHQRVITDMYAAYRATCIKIDEKYLAMKFALNLAMEAQAGNCYEMAGLAFHYLFTNYLGDRLNYVRPEMFQFYRAGIIGKMIFDPSGDVYDTKIDHFCAAIGRTCGDDDWRTWNPEAIIIDPWIGRWFYASELHKENPWPFHAPTKDIRFKIYMRLKYDAPMTLRSVESVVP